MVAIAQKNKAAATAMLNGQSPYKNAANLKVENKRGETALIIAAQYYPEFVADLLGKQPGIINAKYKGGNTDLIKAAALGLNQSVENLLKVGANPAIQNDKKETALIVSINNHRTTAALAIIPVMTQEALNAQDYLGNTALIYAASLGDLDVVKALLAKGADLSIKNNKGETAFIVARALKRTAAVDLLK